MHHKFYCIQYYQKFENFCWPIVKMAANNAKIDRVGSFDTGFQQFLLVQILKF